MPYPASCYQKHTTPGGIAALKEMMEQGEEQEV
jgi:hypothetical protein